MYRNFNPECLGVTGRQSELIELALSYRFKGMDLDMSAFAKQVELRGFEHANRFLESANLLIGTFQLPVRWTGDEPAFREDLVHLKTVAEIAGQINAKNCLTTVMAASDELPFQDNFEFHRSRLSEVAAVLAPHEIKLGLGFLATAGHREGHQFEFIGTPDKLLPLVEMIGMPNVGVAIDLWNWHVGGGTTDQIKGLRGDQIVSVRVADVPEGDLSQVNDEQRLMPGSTGVAPAHELIKCLEELEFEGPVTPLPHPSQFRRTTRDNIVHQAAESLKVVWQPAPVLPEETEEDATVESAVESAVEPAVEPAVESAVEPAKGDEAASAATTS